MGSAYMQLALTPATHNTQCNVPNGGKLLKFCDGILTCQTLGHMFAAAVISQSIKGQILMDWSCKWYGICLLTLAVVGFCLGKMYIITV